MKVLVLCVWFSCALAQTFLPADSPEIHYEGRVIVSNGVATFDWTSVQITTTVCNTSYLALLMSDVYGKYGVFFDEDVDHPVIVDVNPSPNQTVTLPTLSCHRVTVMKLTEAANNWDSVAQFQGFKLYGANAKPADSVSLPQQDRFLEFFGDSITCGYSNTGNFTTPCTGMLTTYDNQDSSQTYEAFLSEYFQAGLRVECWSGKGVVRNYGDSQTMSVDPFPIYFNRTYAVDPTPTYDFSLYRPSAVYINLGTNDYSTEPSPSEDQFTTGYRNFMANIRAAYGADTVFFLACGPMIGDPCCTYVENVATTEANAHYIDLQNILTYPTDYSCGHPTVSGHMKMAQKSAPIIAKVMRW